MLQVVDMNPSTAADGNIEAPDDAAEIRQALAGGQDDQRVGALVEEIFKEMLESKGFVVKRTGIGSDYSVESDVVENGEESGLSIQGYGKQFLVEIKSTRGDAVRMTVTQMQTATENKDEFFYLSNISTSSLRDSGERFDERHSIFFFGCECLK